MLQDSRDILLCKVTVTFALVTDKQSSFVSQVNKLIKWVCLVTEDEFQKTAKKWKISPPYCTEEVTIKLLLYFISPNKIQTFPLIQTVAAVMHRRSMLKWRRLKTKLSSGCRQCYLRKLRTAWAKDPLLVRYWKMPIG